MRQPGQLPNGYRLREALHRMPAARFELGVASQATLDLLGDKNLARWRKIGQTRRKVY